MYFWSKILEKYNIFASDTVNHGVAGRDGRISEQQGVQFGAMNCQKKCGILIRIIITIAYTCL